MANATFGRQFQAPSTPSRPIWTSVSGPSYPYTPSRPIWTSVSGPSYPYTPSRPIWTSVSGPYMHYHCAVSSFKPKVCIEDKMANFITFLRPSITFTKLKTTRWHLHAYRPNFMMFQRKHVDKRATCELSNENR